MFSSEVRRSVAIVSFLACAATACGDEADAGEADKKAESPAIWVGSVSGSDAKVSFVFSPEQVSAFFCGGPTSFQDSTHWFSGAASGDILSLTKDGATLEGMQHADSLHGSLRKADGAELSWTASRIDPATLAGLYEGVAPCGRLGLIVTQPTPREAPSGQGACVGLVEGRLVVEQVNPVLPLSRNAASEIMVKVGAGDQEFAVHPMVLETR